MCHKVCVGGGVRGEALGLAKLQTQETLRICFQQPSFPTEKLFVREQSLLYFLKLIAIKHLRWNLKTKKKKQPNESYHIMKGLGQTGREFSTI